MSSKCHPGLGELGIEGLWGKSKLEYRRHINDENSNNLHTNTLKVLCVKMMFLGRVRKFGRKTRKYRWVYARLRDAKTHAQLGALHACNDDKLIRTMVASCRAHRNIKDQEVRFLDSVSIGDVCGAIKRCRVVHGYNFAQYGRWVYLGGNLEVKGRGGGGQCVHSTTRILMRWTILCFLAVLTGFS